MPARRLARLQRLAAACAFAGTLTASVCSAASAVTPAAWHPVIYAVTVNGVQTSDGAVLETDASGAIYARVSDLRDWHLLLPLGQSGIGYRGATYFDIRHMPGVNVGVDPGAQRIDLQASSSALQGTSLDLGRRAAMHAERGAGAFLNYDLYASKTSNEAASYNGLFETGISGKAGVLTNSIVAESGSAQSVQRLQTTFRRDDAEHMRTLSIGDAATLETGFSPSIRFGGVQVQSDYATQPLFATYPTPTVRGSAAAPSLLDVYVNDVFAMRKDVAAGPFALQNLPLVSGAGNVALVVKDVLGQQHLVNAPYYFTRDLLKPGLSSYSYAAGFERTGGADAAYGPFIAEATQRRGVTDHLTAGAHVEYAPSHAMAALTADALNSKLGVFSFALANSEDHGTAGALWSVAYDYRSNAFSAGGLYQQTTPGFRTLDLSDLTNAGRQVELHGSLQLGGRSAVSASVGSTTSAGGTSAVWTASYSGSVRRIPFSISAYRAAGANVSTTGIRANVFFATSRRGLVTEDVSAGGSTPGVQTTYSESAPESGVGLSYDVTAGTGGAASGASARYYGTSAAVTADVTSGAGASAADASVSGGIVFGHGRAAAVQSVSGGYGFASVPGYAGIPVYVNNVLVGKTDATGNVAFSNLAPYSENVIRLETSRLPATAQIEETERIVVPYAKNPVFVTFNAKGSTAATARVKLADGADLPAGATLSPLGGGQQWPVGTEGRVYLSPVEVGTLHVVAKYGDGVCNATAAVPASADDIANLGTIVCTPVPIGHVATPHATE